MKKFTVRAYDYKALQNFGNWRDPRHHHHSLLLDGGVAKGRDFIVAPIWVKLLGPTQSLGNSGGRLLTLFLPQFLELKCVLKIYTPKHGSEGKTLKSGSTPGTNLLYHTTSCSKISHSPSPQGDLRRAAQSPAPFLGRFSASLNT